VVEADYSNTRVRNGSNSRHRELNFRKGSWSCEKALAELDRPAAASLAASLVSFCQFWLFCQLVAGLALSGTGSDVMMTGRSSPYLRRSMSVLRR